ncbi:hypothetical protein FACS1894218_6270 [Bacilli bacterium]|nr:hypothetical protein FACS1894218_6270 [Bacilli bacterium]
MAQNYLSVPSQLQETSTLTQTKFDTNRLDLNVVDTSHIDAGVGDLGRGTITDPENVDQYLNPDW